MDCVLINSVHHSDKFNWLLENPTAAVHLLHNPHDELKLKKCFLDNNLESTATCEIVHHLQIIKVFPAAKTWCEESIL